MMDGCLTGIACLACLCGGFWVLEHVTKRRWVKVFPVVNDHHHGMEVEQREDKISQLPDDVILLIVSRLHTRDAIRTSVLSRRWKHVYNFISEFRFYCHMMFSDSPPCYDLKDEKLSEFQRKFVQVVDTFLQNHSGSRISSFELLCCFRGCISDGFGRWMNYVGRLGVERLTLGYCCPIHVKSNPPVFSFNYLLEAPLVNHLCLMGGSFQISRQNALKDLELIDVAFTSEAIKCILLNCCHLQSLKLKSCILPSKLHVHGPDLQLKNLTLFNCSKVLEVDLSAMNLTTFELCTLRMLRLSFSNVPLLQILFVEICDPKMGPYVFRKVAKQLQHLKCMYFGTDARFFEAFEVGGVGKLRNLRQLSLLLVSRNKLDLLALTTILDACPLLHKFHLSMRLASTFNGKRADKRFVRHHTQLKEVEFSGFSGTENEYDFISYILANAVSLKRLSIFVDFRTYDVYLGSWRRTDGNGRDDKKKQRMIHERLQRYTISRNLEIVVV